MKNSATSIILNREQQQAVTHNKGPLLIIAGAGTGKTTVITERIKWLIEDKNINPQEILALTFTEKAAREMEERVDVALPYGLPEMWISTFHSFGERVLRQDALTIGLDPGFKLMSEAESVIFFRQNLFQFDLQFYRPLGNPHKFIEALLTHFDRLKDEDISPKVYLAWAKKKASDQYLELANAFSTYEELKIKESVMDFADLITNALLLFRDRKNILREYQDRFKYILIDEFQDTNIAQNELAILLSGDKKNITTVADDDQAIYRWRGAAVSNIIQFRKRFPKVKIIVLKQNYRSTSAILEASYKLIQNNNPDRLEVKEKISKKLIPVRKIAGDPIDFIFANRVENEAEEVAWKIKEEMKENNKNVTYSDFAVLVRANQHADAFIRAFQRASISYQFLGPGMLFKQPEVKDLIAYLKFLVNIDDSVALFRILNHPIFDIPIRDLTSLLNFTRRIGVTLYEALDILVADKKQLSDLSSRRINYRPYLPYFSEISVSKFIKIFDMIDKHLQLIKKETAGQILYSFLETSGLLKKFTKYESSREEKEVLNISKFFDKLKSYEVTNEDASVLAIVDWIDMSMELGESPLSADTDWVKNDAVNILTVHSAKGLEFKYVFLVNLVSDRFPTRERKEKIPVPVELVKEILPVGDYHLEEERRLFYVGLTRARDKCFLSAASYYGEGKRIRKISSFVIETLGKEVLSKVNKSEQEQNSQLTLLEWKKEEEEEKKSIHPSIEYLSFTQINTFLTCPLQYKYRFVLKIPVPASAAASFGSSIHLALQKFYENYKQDKNADKKNLLNLLDEVWIPLGYGNKKYEEKMKDRGKNMLSLYYDKAHSQDIVVTDLEKLFRLKLDTNLKLGGKIDRVDKLETGKMEIIDYKTGRRPKDTEIAKNLQMTVYALAANDRGLYNLPPQNVLLSFYFLEEGVKVSSQRNQEDLDNAKQQLITIAHDINNSNFNPKVGSWCDFCDFRLICEAWQ
ncbi:hypothetical protein A2153_00510 [Candidatus Gottesmanbacteria bacterium RBG_16_38_7b]|uniref:DNA 3'-5' helicase n=1 Tax=Candidatus Gottesmanbacteria bacterium RBG_16_38_7b TaxID=1798372 RepID=A0A1F5YIA4_9BACT|nr:MAG: hypothetical protein A2153_00510 [Candidatus Gottesmanbacteria bacterium RBG_16_38_7b]